MSSVIEARIYHLPKEATEAATSCGIQLKAHLISQPLEEFLLACAQTDPILGLGLELRHPGANGHRLGIYVILPQGAGLPDTVSGPHDALIRQIQRLRVPVVSHASFVYAPSGNVKAKLTQLKATLSTHYCLAFIPLLVDRQPVVLHTGSEGK